jgi:3-oxoadipate enol-lactonase
MPTVSTNGVRLNYIREGDGQPVLLLHGYLFGAGWWRPQIEALRDRFDVIAVDLRGQMDSETTDGGYDLWNQAEDAYGVLDQLGAIPAHCVGLSMGAMIAMRLALRHPEAVRSLVLMDTSAAPEDTEKAERYEGMAQVVEAGQLEAVLPALPPIFLTDEFIVAHHDVVDEWLERLRAANHAGLVHTMRAINGRDDVSARLGEIRVPALVIHGEDDVAIPLDRAAELAQGIAGAALRTVPGAHQSNVDTPDETSRLILDFLVEAAAR